MAYIVIENPKPGQDSYKPRGGARSLWKCKDQEVMLAGPAETGKTFSCLMKLNALMWKYPGAQSVIVRKTASSMPSSVLQTFEKKILKMASKDDPNHPIKIYGGEKAQWYDYPNGSRVWIAGMDNPQKALSSERDFIYVNQAEELNLKDWETLLTRATGRAGNAPYAQVMGDCNPGPPSHWIKKRVKRKSDKDVYEEGKSLTFFESKHEDNPTLFDEQGKITEQGIRSLRALDSLTGLLKQRLRYGKWVAAEGQIYNQYNSEIHVIPASKVPYIEYTVESVDFGYTHPFAWQLWGFDNDKGMYLLKEIYMTQKIVEDHCSDIKRARKQAEIEYKGNLKPKVLLCDHDAEDRKTMERHLGMKTQKAHKKDMVRPGIEAVEIRMKPQLPKNKPRIFFVENCLYKLDTSRETNRLPTCATEEIEMYVWDENKDAPVKEFDDAMDAMRYAVIWADLQKRGQRRRSQSFSG